MAGNREKTKTRKKRRGLRFFVNFILLLGAAGIIFWFGSVNLRLEEGNIGIIFTKTGGYDPNPVVAGEWSWRWGALLPTNLTLHAFNIKSRKLNLRSQGVLPSGDLYAAVAGDGADFSWELEVELDYQIKAERLPEMLSDVRFNGDLNAFYSDFERRVSSELEFLVASIPSRSTDTTASLIEKLQTDLMSRVKSIDSNISILDLVLLSWQVPDVVLYESSRQLYQDYMQQRQELLVQLERDTLFQDDEQDRRIELLSRYGKVLSENPILLDFFALDGNPGQPLLPQNITSP